MTSITIPKKNYAKEIRTYTALTVGLLIVALVYGYFQYQKLVATNQAMADGQNTINQLTAANNKMKDLYAGLKSSFDKDFASLKDGISAVFPDNENYTELTRRLDNYVEKNTSQVTPLFMSDLKFSEPRKDANKDYSVLPFNLTLSTSNDNFMKFLRFVENSGSISEGTRLMDVNSISIDFPTDTSGSAGEATTVKALQPLNVTFGLNAYFQKL